MKEEFKKDKKITGAELISKWEKCDTCKKRRAARAAVAMNNNDDRLGRQPFSTAPYIHQLNDPKHASNLQRIYNLGRDASAQHQLGHRA